MCGFMDCRVGDFEASVGIHRGIGIEPNAVKVLEAMSWETDKVVYSGTSVV